MRSFAKPTVFASACLGFEACRWNGMTIHSEVVERLNGYVNFVVHCPEKEIGLGVPRDPIRIIEEDGQRKLYQPSSGRDYTEDMEHFVAGVLSSLPDVDGFILKHRSPSCGPRDVKLYPGPDSKKAASQKTRGFLGGAVVERFEADAVEDEGRLTNFTLRERFLTRIFTLADFRRVRAAGKMAKLVDFHSRHKLLLMAFNQKELRAMGKMTANADGCPAAELIADYETHLRQALAQPLKRGSVVNVLMHALGYFKTVLSAPEKAHFLELLEQYRSEKLPLSAVNSLLRSWILRDNSDYLAQQSFFEPYPLDLTDIHDSGKGRSYA